MVENLNRRKFLQVGSVAVGATALAGCLGDDDEEEEFPNRTLQLVNHYSEGGGLDQNFRELQPFWEEQIDGTWSQTYQPGAGTRNGISYMINNTDPDMHSVGMLDGVSMASARAFDVADDSREPVFSPEQIEYIGTLTAETTIIRIREDEDRFSDINGFVEYVQDNPGEVVMGSSGPTNRFSQAGIQLIDALDLDMRIVPFDGGGPVETALLQEEVDVIPRGVYNSRSIEDDSTAIAMYWDENNWPEITNDAPPINDALGLDLEYGPTVGANVYYTTAEAAENHPDRYETMVETFEAAGTSEDYLASLDEVDEFERDKVDVQGSEYARNLVEDGIETYSDFVPLFQQYVED